MPEQNPEVMLDDVILSERFTLQGVNLIEASAGTGKTYSIETIFLRLVIVHGIPVQKILVVTFTEAATHELRDRLRGALQRCGSFLNGVAGENLDEKSRIRMESLVSLPLLGPKVDDPQAERRTRIMSALLDFDDAAIHTIHAFCNTALRRYAFECGQPFNTELTGSEDLLLEEACQDWWRKNSYRPNPVELNFDLKKIVQLAKTIIAQPYAVLEPLACHDDDIDYQNVSIDELCRTDREHLIPVCAALQAVEIYRQRKNEQNLFTYDDLILNLRNALQDTSSGERLRTILRQDYLAAFIDEFQDTDPLQYAIFKHIFIEGENCPPIFLVGDPKQAIYSFRNGDIFTYFSAREAQPVPNRYVLATNHRSEQLLVDAVNTIFKDRFTAEDPSMTIAYSGTLQAEGKGIDESLTTQNEDNTQHIDRQPFRIWHYTIEPQGQNKVTADKPEYQRIFNDVAKEIQRLLSDPLTMIAGRRIQPGDIAVLVNRHREGTYILQHLRSMGIPAISQNAGNIFSTEEAKDFYMLLQVLADPQNPAGIRNLLATDLFPIDDSTLLSLATTGRADPLTWNEILQRFLKAQSYWLEGGPIKGVGSVLDDFEVPTHLLRLSNGERKLTNLLHIMELSHKACIEKRLSIEGTIDWLRRQIETDTREEDDTYLLRLESDAHAVKIMTIFKSKGLQFPVVFIPTLGICEPYISKKASTCSYHRRTTTGYDWEVVIDSAKSETGKTATLVEQELEKRRLFYVAATRAVHRCYTVWGKFRDPDKDNCPLSRVLRTHHADNAGNSSQYDADAQRCPGLCEVGGPIQFDNKGIPDKFDMRSLFQLPAVQHVGNADGVLLSLWQPGSGKEFIVNKNRRHTSYSGIAPAHKKESSLRDVDAEDIQPILSDEDDSIDIFTFPGGKKIGTCWHEIFEDIDFSDAAPDAKPERKAHMIAKANTIIDRYRICQGRDEDEETRKRDIIFTMLGHVLSADLADGERVFRLYQVSRKDRRSEMDFDFPLRNGKYRTTNIRAVLEKYWGNDPVKGAFVRSLFSWDREIPQGFMTGFIDLLFRKDGRYYVLDWKSNRRAGKIEDFEPTGLAAEMAEHAYYLQYLIYVVATHQYLRGCLPEYDYDTHIGGVFYIFLRGVSPDNKKCGIYFDRPSKDMIEDLSATLGDFSDDANI